MEENKSLESLKKPLYEKLYCKTPCRPAVRQPSH